MVKVRIQGTPNDIKWFKKLLNRHKKVKMLRESENFPNKGTNKYFRSYLEIDKQTE